MFSFAKILQKIVNRFSCNSTSTEIKVTSWRLSVWSIGATSVGFSGKHVPRWRGHHGKSFGCCGEFLWRPLRKKRKWDLYNVGYELCSHHKTDFRLSISKSFVTNSSEKFISFEITGNMMKFQIITCHSHLLKKFWHLTVTVAVIFGTPTDEYASFYSTRKSLWGECWRGFCVIYLMIGLYTHLTLISWHWSTWWPTGDNFVSVVIHKPETIFCEYCYWDVLIAVILPVTWLHTVACVWRHW
jgi:hypothetical protein